MALENNPSTETENQNIFFEVSWEKINIKQI